MKKKKTKQNKTNKQIHLKMIHLGPSDAHVEQHYFIPQQI